MSVRLATLGATLAVAGADMTGAGDGAAPDVASSGAGATGAGDELIGPKHRSVQRLRRLARQRADRTDEGAYVIDGPTLLDEALRAGVAVDEVIAEPGVPQGLLDEALRAGAVVHQARAGALARATDTVSPQPVAAIARFEQPGEVDAVVAGLPAGAMAVVLVGVNDPGNAGTVLRSAEAAGAALVAFCDGAVDPYNPKCVRGSAGALFRVPTVREAAAADVLAALRRSGVRCLGTVARGGTRYDEVDLASGGVALVLGSESHGLPAELAAQLDDSLSIPMAERVESLNLAMAATILCFEAQRQRRLAGEQNQLDATTDAGAGCNPP